jgi:glycerol uptake facilitator-like aquaporin
MALARTLVDKLNPLRLFRKQTWIDTKNEVIRYDFYSSVLFEMLASFLFYYFIFSTSINTFVNLKLSIQKFSEAVANNALSTASYPTDLGYLIGAISTGIALALLVLTMGPLSGTHMNPFITLGFVFVKDFSVIKGVAYICAQLIASVCAAVLAPLPFMTASDDSGFPYDLAAATVVHPYPGIKSGVVIIMEAILTLLFVFFLFMISFDPEDSTYLPQRSLRLKYSLTPAQAQKGAAAVKHILARQHGHHHTRRASQSTLEDMGDEEAAAGTNGEQSGTYSQPAATSSSSSSSSDDSSESTSVDNMSGEEIIAHLMKDMAPQFYRLERSVDNASRQIVQFLISFAFGLVIAVVIWTGSTISGGGFNAARVFGPAIINNDWTDQYAYWVGGLIGCILACLLYHFVYVKARRKNSTRTSNAARELYEAHL